eukprot:3936413-Rhodomonas_salina.1
MHGQSYTASDLKSIGRIVAEKYRMIHDKDPKKVSSVVNGTMQKVNLYFQKDLECVQTAVNEYFAQKKKSDEGGVRIDVFFKGVSGLGSSSLSNSQNISGSQ